MNYAERIAQLEAAMDLCLTQAQEWLDEARAILANSGDNRSDNRSVGTEMGEYESWIKTARDLAETIQWLRELNGQQNPQRDPIRVSRRKFDLSDA